jgi:hypothetical protein
MLPAIVTTLFGQGLSLLANATFSKGSDWLKEKTGIDLAAGALSSSDVVALKKYEMDNQVELLKLQQSMINLGLDTERMYLEDMQSARAMQSVALNQDDKFSKRFVYYFALFWSVCTALYIGCITFMVIPQENVRFADTILGVLLGTVLGQILSFFYGSSRQSQTKDDTLHSAIQKINKDKQ